MGAAIGVGVEPRALEEDGEGAEELGGHHGGRRGGLGEDQVEAKLAEAAALGRGSAVHSRSAASRMVAAAWNCASAEALCSRM